MKYYTNIEVYANSLVQDIMLNGNGDAAEAAKEYYPKYVKADGTVVEAINTLGLVPGGDSQETALYTVMFNGDDVQSTDGFFSFGTADNKHSFNGKFSGSYDGLTYSSGLKMEGSTLIQFTTTATSTVTIVQSTWSEKTLKFDNETISLASATTPAGSEGVRVYTIYNVPAGEHKITRGDGESGVFRVEVKYDGTSGIAAAKAASADDAAEQYNLEGQRVDDSYKGIVIRNGKKFIRK